MTIAPKISVIMPFYNAAKFLDESIQSILGQTFKDFEFIIINDASTDESSEVVQKYVADERIIYIVNEKNVGITENLNYGLTIAKAPIIARMDGDDISESRRFNLQYAFLQANPKIDFVGAFAKIIDEKGNVTDERRKPTDPDEIYHSAIYYNPLLHPSVMFRKETVLALGGYDLSHRTAQDMHLWLKALYSGYKISNIPEFLLRYRQHGLSTMHHARKNALSDYRLRMEIVSNFKVDLTLKQRFQVLAQFIVGYILSGTQRRYVEGLYKKIAYGSK